MASASSDGRARGNRAVLGAALAHGVLTVTALRVAAAGDLTTRVTIAVVLGIVMCWASNTISHIHLHTPLFRAPTANRLFSLYLSLALAVPQRWWKLRHLAHHGLGELPRLGLRGGGDVVAVAEIALVVAVLATVAAAEPTYVATVVAPALAVGYGLGALQGHEEHARASAGVDHHGRVYNVLWFNDGYHAAHHRVPAAHWTEIVAFAEPTDVLSKWPPIVRPVERIAALCNRAVSRGLDRLERLAMLVRWTRAFQLRRHARAFAALISPSIRARIRNVTVIGGGLFPRSVLVLAPLLPPAQFRVLDQEAEHIAEARAILSRAGLLHRVVFEHGAFDLAHLEPCDLLVVPLAFRGDRSLFYRAPPAPLVAVHDWIWRRGGQASAVVSVLLAKRINVVARGFGLLS